jgi:enoyl-CoA hydratase
MLENYVRYAREGALGIVTIDRPQARNAINAASWQGLLDAFALAAADAEVRVVALRGTPQAFAAGDDIKEAAELMQGALDGRHSMLRVRDITLLIQQVSVAIRALPKPVIAVVSGWALGAGFELALICDFVYASRDARFGFPEARVGFTITGGITHVLPHIIGLARAKELAFRYQIVDADAGERLGFVNRVFDTPDDLWRGVLDATADIARNSPVAIGFMKAGFDSGAESSFGAALVHERELILACLASRDGQEGVRAFAEKREPQFTGD